MKDTNIHFAEKEDLVFEIYCESDKAASIQFKNGGKIQAVINSEGQPELQLTGPLNLGDSGINSKH